MRWLVLETMNAAESRSDDISEAMGYPHPSTDTERATLPIEHPTNGKGAVPIAASVWSWGAEESIDMASLPGGSPKSLSHRLTNGTSSEQRISLEDCFVVRPRFVRCWLVVSDGCR